MGDAWAGLLDSRDDGGRDDRPVAELHRELQALTADARARSLVDLTLLCEKLAELTLLAQRRRYDVPEELFLTVSMGIELLGVLVDDTRGGADIAGFVSELDAVLRDVRLLPDLTVSEVPPSSTRRAASTSSGVTLAGAQGQADHLSRETRLRLGRAATSVYLEAMCAAGPSALRLRESWLAFRRELVALGRVSLRARLMPPLEQIEARAAACEKNVQVAIDVDDVAVPEELARALESSVTRLAERAVADGIDAPAERARLGKQPTALVRIEGRVGHGKVTVSVEDDGSGIDVTAVHRAALAKGFLPAGAALDEQQALALVFDRRFAAAGGIGAEVDLAAVREGIARQGGTLHVRSSVGRGAALTVLMADGMTVNVRTFRCPSANVLFAVDSSWSVSDAVGFAGRIDVVRALGLRSRNEITASRTVVFGRDNLAFDVEVRATPALNVATRLFPHDPESVTEVVLVGDAEAILVRLDLLAKGTSQSTVPPPTTRVAVD